MLKALAIFLTCVVALAVFVWVVGVSSCNYPPKKKQSENAQTNQSTEYNCTSSYSTFKVGLYQSWSFVHGAHEEVVAVGTIFIAIFTIVLGLFTVSLAGSTQELVRETRQTGERQLRAYISITPKNVMNWKLNTVTNRV